MSLFCHTVIVTEHVRNGNADLVLVMADASQLRRSLYMLADFAGTPVPAVLVLNMMDVAEGQGIAVDTKKLSAKLGIPIVPMSAIRKKDYETLYRTVETVVTAFTKFDRPAIAMSWAVPCGATLSVVPTLDIFLRALRVIFLVSIVFFLLAYGFGGTAESSLLYKFGVFIEPVTLCFGLKWQAFLAFCASGISKESLLGMLNTLYGTGGNLVSSTFGAKVSGAAAAGISQILAANFTKPEGLAFIFVINFNMSCVSALAATTQETHSVKWTAKIGVFYTITSLLISCVVYHIGLLVFPAL